MLTCSVLSIIEMLQPRLLARRHGRHGVPGVHPRRREVQPVGLGGHLQHFDAGRLQD
jgi:hypothetical protein